MTTVAKWPGVEEPRSRNPEAQLRLYRKTINEIDDYFEYRRESRQDAVEVYRILDKLTAGLKDLHADIPTQSKLHSNSTVA